MKKKIKIEMKGLRGEKGASVKVLKKSFWNGWEEVPVRNQRGERYRPRGVFTEYEHWFAVKPTQVQLAAILERGYIEIHDGTWKETYP